MGGPVTNFDYVKNIVQARLAAQRAVLRMGDSRNSASAGEGARLASRGLGS